MKNLRVGVPFGRYVEMPGTNASFLKRFSRSPLHARTPQDASDAMDFGSAAHCAVLEPERFARDFVVWDKRTESGSMSPRRGKVWDEFQDRHKDAEIITPDQYARACVLRDTVRAEPAAMRYLRTGFAEVCVQWKRGERDCKARLDWVTRVDGETVIVDLKTTRDVRADVFGRSAASLLYPLQIAWYLDGYKAATGDDARFVVIAVESESPYAVGVFSVGADVVDLGRSQYETQLARVQMCEASGEWPGPVRGEQPLILPAWAWPDGEDGGGGEDLDWSEEAA